MTDFEKQKQFLIEQMPEHLKTLFEGGINTLIIHYNDELKRALIDLYYAVPSQDDDHDWWPDELTEAMGNAFKLIS